MQFFQIIQKCYGHRDLPNCVRIQSISHQYHMLFSTLLTGNTEITTEYPRRVQRLVNSSGQDIIFGVTGGRQKPPKQILLPYAVKTLTNAVELIQVLNRREHGIAYSQIEEINTALWLQKWPWHLIIRLLCQKIFRPMPTQRLRRVTLIDYKWPFQEWENRVE